ncbi:hypothetical protein F4861DRAFT_520606 [Xylaria intraflava]|nr:hypothetical protein F4861DRAFT_520606 [Xylaria intraflava]
MGESIEARSLAALNQLAANPPQYPTKPNEVRQDPLTLYISRVPGTRDIILSTLKPQMKNVTAEDISSSLYYVHFQTPEDESLVPPNQFKHGSSPRSSGEQLRPQIHRKPLPATPAIPTVPATPSGKENQGYGLPTRKPAPTIVPAESFEHRPHTPTTAGYQTPLTPRSSPDKTRQHASPLPNTFSPLFHELPHADGQAPSLPPRPGNRHVQSGPGDVAFVAPNTATSAYTLPNPKRRPFNPFSLTLIRRDPSSGQQWNVGKIASFQLQNPEYIDDEKRHQVYPSIKIHIETSGYAKFRGMPATSEMALPGALNFRPGSSSSAMRPQSLDIVPSMSASGVFERQVKMTYSPSFTANLRQHFRGRSSVDEGQATSPKHSSHNRDASRISIGSFGGEFDGSDAPAMTQPAPGLKPRGYVFHSPWYGRCEFMTGNVGRTLKCRHVLPSYGGGIYNPLVRGSDPEHGDERADNTRPISELRFNLPSSELLADKRSAEGGVRARDQIQSQFNKMVAKAQGLEDSDDGDFHLDLSLGREKAGGGNKGKRAKMGKLIIFDEGLKMLDLTVAANVGIWWTTWERTFH